MAEKFPTPRSREGNAGQSGSLGSKHNAAKGYLDGVIQEKFPTPTALDHKGSGTNSTTRDRLDYAVEKPDGERLSGQLNPQWVDWLMGYPPGWTDIEDSLHIGLHSRKTNKIKVPDWVIEPEISRLTTEKKHRTSRLKGLGNAIVPQIAMMLWRQIKQYVDEKSTY